MPQNPLVLVLSRKRSVVTTLVRNLKAHQLAVYGTSSLDRAIRSITSHQPKDVVADPTTEECSALLERSGGWKSITLMAIAESEKTALKARQIGIKNVIRDDDTDAIVRAVLELVQKCA